MTMPAGLLVRALVTGGLAIALVVAVSPPAAAEDHEPYAVRMFKAEHQSAEAMARAIRHLGSGEKESRLEANDEMDSITVRDRPANLAAIEQAIKQLDTPRPDVAFNMRVLIAGPQGPGDVPADLQKVVRQLEQNLRFKAYHQVAAVTQRVRSGAKLDSRGTIQLNPPAADKGMKVGYEIGFRPVVTGSRKGARSIQIRSLRFEFEGRDIGKAEINTDVVLPEGEIVVVGTAALGDRALVLVVWASAI